MDKSPKNPQNVVDMSQYQPETGYTAIAQVEAYWEAIRGNRLVPKRSDIDPRGIERALENAFILERIAPGVARIRLAGSHMNDLIGMECRGMPLTAFFTPAARKTLSNALEDVFQGPATASFAISSAKSITRPALEGKLVLLPLKSDLGDVSRLLGCWVSKGKIGSAPRRFDIVTSNVTHLTSDTAPDMPVPSTPSAPIARPQSAPLHGMSEPETPFVPKRRATDKTDDNATAERPPYLRLIKSDD